MTTMTEPRRLPDRTGPRLPDPTRPRPAGRTGPGRANPNKHLADPNEHPPDPKEHLADPNTHRADRIGYPSGEADRWVGVLAAHRTDLVRAARSRLGNGGADAEDVVHDVAVRLLRRGRSAGEVDAPGAYLRRAVGNECVSRWRRTAREVTVAELPDRLRPAHDEAVLDRIALTDALRTLTDRQRRVVALTVLDDRPDSEVAAQLGVSEITVRTTRSRALGRLRIRLEAMDSAA